MNQKTKDEIILNLSQVWSKIADAQDILDEITDKISQEDPAG